MTARTQKIRVAVAVGPDGGWWVSGGSGLDDDQAQSNALEFMSQESYEGAHVVWVTAEVPIPAPQEIAGEVEES